METKTRLKLFFIDNLVWFINIGLYIFFAVLNPKGFLTFQNVEFILYTSSMIGMLVFAEAIILTTGNMDLSLAQNAGLSAMVGGFVTGVLFTNLPGWVGILIVIGTGAALGAVNGLLVGKIGYNAFLATLATFLIFDWTTSWIRRGAIVNLSNTFLAPGRAQVGGIHVAIFIFVGVVIALHLLLRKTKFGLHIYSTGGNPDTTEMMGINVGNVLLWVFTMGGAMAGMAGLLYAGYVTSVTSTLAEGVIFNAFAGAIIGGISLRGGRGRITGAMGGVILLGILEAGLTMLNVSPSVRGVLTGIVLLVAIFINMSISRLRDEILMPS